MRLRIMICFLFSVVQTAFSQDLKDAPPELTKEVVDKNLKESACVFNNKYSPVERSKFFPFNTATEVKIVSFSSTNGSELPMKGKEIDYSKFKESKTLSNKQVNELTNILFNYSYKGKPIVFFEKLCYNPRNAILFINSKGKTFAYIEICFECDRFELSSNEIKLDEFCIGKYKMLRRFFIKNGIYYGTKKHYK